MIRIDASGGKPIYEQIIDNIKEDVLKGYLKEGDAIPSVRKLALSLSITPGTVAKAYQELERQKIIVTIRGKGTFISSKPQGKVDEDKMNTVREILKAQVIAMKFMDLSREDVMEIVRELYDSLE
ncbi:GntR family transcriptional regulator [Anaerolentibacter hominis]|uniref:GntR family transcriptional regulator n=1 Tax=Anaerolentibacter hominis TaxID=3079009 RepID=UPI0031B8463D